MSITSDDRGAMLAELQHERGYGVVLLVQMGGVPNELQLIVETAEYDPAVQGLRPRGTYIVRVLGILEHRAALGVFGHLRFEDDHPLLYHHNQPKVAVQFDGVAADVHELVLDISQAYTSTFQGWRQLTDGRGDLNTTVPLVDLLKSGRGLLGTMPKVLGERMARVLAHHQVTAHLTEEANFETDGDHGRSRLARALVIDQSYYVALDFSVERMRGRGA